MFTFRALYITFHSINGHHCPTNSHSVRLYQQKNNFTILRHDFHLNKSTFFAPVFGNSPSDDITDQFNYDLLSIGDFIFVFFVAAVPKSRAREGKVPTRYDRRRWNYGCFMFPSKAGGEGGWAGSGKGWNRNWSLTFVEYIVKRHIVRNSNTSHENGSRRKTKRNLNWRQGVGWQGWAGVRAAAVTLKSFKDFFHWNVNIKSKMCENE